MENENEYSDKKKVDLLNQVTELRKKFDEIGYDQMTLEEQKIFIEYHRNIRETKFTLIQEEKKEKSEKKKIREEKAAKPKIGKREAKKLLTLLKMKGNFEDLTEEDEKNIELYEEILK